MPSAAPTRDPETYAIIGAAMEVHRQLGPGFLEAAYREAMTFALANRGIPFVSEVPFRTTLTAVALRRTTGPILSATIRSLWN